MGVFIWEVENERDEDVEVCIMFSLQNGTGTKEDRSGGHWNEPFTFEKEGERVAGVLLHHCTHVNPVTFAIAAWEKVRGGTGGVVPPVGGCTALLSVVTGVCFQATGKGWYAMIWSQHWASALAQLLRQEWDMTSLRAPSLEVGARREALGKACRTAGE